MKEHARVKSSIRIKTLNPLIPNCMFCIGVLSAI